MHPKLALLVMCGNIIYQIVGSIRPNPSLPEQNSGFRPDDNARQDSTSPKGILDSATS
jgi:hypothetical protein